MASKSLPTSRKTDPTLISLKKIALFSGLVVLAIVLAFCYFAGSFCIAIVCSAILAVLLDPLVVRMERARLRRSLAAGIVVTCGVLLLAALGYGAYQKMNSFAVALPKYSSRIQKSLQPIMRRFQTVQRGVETVKPKPQPGTTQVHVESTNWTSYLLRGASSISTLLVVAAMVPFLVFFMLTRKEYMYFRVAQVFREEVDFAAFASSLNRMLRAFAVGFSLIGIGTAAVSSVVFLSIGLKGAIILAFVSGFLNLIPYLGAILAMILPLAAALLQFSSAGPFVVIAVTVLALHLIGTDVVIPRWIGPKLQIGPVAVIIGMLFWGWLWGAIGIVLAVPLTAFLKLLADQYPRLGPLSDFLADSPHFASK
jgi:predicted PurR-regulated permease PerM